MEKKKVSRFEYAIMQVADPEGAKEYQPYTVDEENKEREDRIRDTVAKIKTKPTPRINNQSNE